MNRRQLLQRAGGGMGWLALQSMLHGSTTAAQNPLAPKSPPRASKAKSIIWIFANGGPSHVDTWDYKPELQKRDGQPLPGFDAKTGFFPDAVGPLMKSPFDWAQHGKAVRGAAACFPIYASRSTKWRSSTVAGRNRTITAPRSS